MFRIILTCGLLFLFSCKKDECEGREYFEIFPSIKKAIPYTNSETINYNDSDGDSFSVNVNRVLEVTRPDIPFICDEVLTVFLREEANQIPFIEIVQRGSTQDIDAIIQLTIFYNRDGNGNTAFIEINNDGSLSSFNGEPTFHNNIMLDGSEYDDVIEVTYETSLDDDSIVQLFYNTSFGLLQYTTREGLTVDLER